MLFSDLLGEWCYDSGYNYRQNSASVVIMLNRSNISFFKSGNCVFYFGRLFNQHESLPIMTPVNFAEVNDPKLFDKIKDFIDQYD